MKLTETNSGRWTRIETCGMTGLPLEDAIQNAAERIISRLHGADHFPNRAIGWSILPDRFDAELCRAVGGMTEHTGERLTFQVSH
jgi:hypothetical protein